MLLVFFLAACATGPVDYPRTDSYVDTNTQDTRFGREVEQWQQAHPGMSGFYPLIGGMDALGARLALIDGAERTIDAQYFLMKSDAAGLLFVMKLLEAADRGVRVRFLLDDVFTSVDDEVFVLLDEHPNVEMRLFNPLGRGGNRWLNYVGDFDRANRRMHNKSFTVDNQISIVGGRNIAEEYFELKAGGEFRDADILVAGPLAGEIGRNFDQFWNHSLSVPMEAFESARPDRDLETARAEAADEFGEAMQTIYGQAIGSELMQDLLADRAALFPAEGEMISDAPDKLLNEISVDQQLLVTRMAQVVADAQSEVIVVTPYFIPGPTGVEFWRRLTERGVRVIVLTNSLASTNHVPVHAGYARYRHRLIEAGVELYELRVDAVTDSDNGDRPPVESVTLHTKAMVMDRRYTFIGSLNLDPRSIDINTEMGVLVDSTAMTQSLAVPFMEMLPERAYKVFEDDNGNLRWKVIIDGEEIVETSEPQSSSWRRFKAFLSRILPESQL
ncbi:MAG: phospholipase D family protein [Betaproteobacteria bacterium]|nr:MAG: phospholipase D family protein [Betaproteobacteria bacterium]